jgi:hypothetical protein
VERAVDVLAGNAGNAVNGDGAERKDSKVKVQAKMQLDGRWFGVVGRAEW